MDTLRIGLLGCGTVGTGVVRVLSENAEDIRARLGVQVEIARIAVRDGAKPRDKVIDPALLTTNPSDVIDDPAIAIVVELIGGVEPARTLIGEAIARGKHVVTANKALLATRGPELFEAADARGVDIIFEASVGGGIPIIRTLREGLASDRIEEIAAIINGTSNFILTDMDREGADYAAMVRKAQEAGYAEADPTLDVGGSDAAQKLSILMSISFGSRIPWTDIHVEGLDTVTATDLVYAREFGLKCKPIAMARLVGEGLLEARVHPALLPRGSLLAAVDGVFNAIFLRSRGLGPSLFYGRGAGMMPTAVSVVSDVIELGRNLLRGTSGRIPHFAFHDDLLPAMRLRSMDEVQTRYYLRFQVADQPGVLGSIASVLGARGISIAQMVQKEPSGGTDGAPVDVVMVTHRAREGDVRMALKTIDSSVVTRAPTRLLRIEEGFGA